MILIVVAEIIRFMESDTTPISTVLYEFLLIYDLIYSCFEDEEHTAM